MPRQDPIHRAATSILEADGWKLGNAGECRVALALRRLGISPVECEQQFRLGPYRLDFAFVAQRVNIEADGWVHTTDAQRRRDGARDRQLKEWDWQVFRVDVDADEDELVARVERALMVIGSEWRWKQKHPRGSRSTPW